MAKENRSPIGQGNERDGDGLMKLLECDFDDLEQRFGDNATGSCINILPASISNILQKSIDSLLSWEVFNCVPTTSSKPRYLKIVSRAFFEHTLPRSTISRELPKKTQEQISYDTHQIYFL